MITLNVTSQMGGFERVSKRLAKISSGHAADMYRILGIKAEQLIVAGFQNSTDPYGEPWKPLKYRTGQPLVDTGVLRRSFGVSPTGGYVDVVSGVKYGIYHQKGDGVPQRKIVPDDGVPKKWEQQMYRAISNWLSA